MMELRNKIARKINTWSKMTQKERTWNSVLVVKDQDYVYLDTTMARREGEARFPLSLYSNYHREELVDLLWDQATRENF